MLVLLHSTQTRFSFPNHEGKGKTHSTAPDHSIGFDSLPVNAHIPFQHLQDYTSVNDNESHFLICSSAKILVAQCLWELRGAWTVSIRRRLTTLGQTTALFCTMRLRSVVSYQLHLLSSPLCHRKHTHLSISAWLMSFPMYDCLHVACMHAARRFCLHACGF